MTRTAYTLFVLAALVSAAPALAQTEPNLAAVQAHVEAARGVRPASERTVTTFTRYGLAGTEVELRSGEDYRSDTTEGGILGPSLFRLFTVYLDFQHREVYLAPNATGSSAINR
jgi:hypothetical protein